MLIRLIPDNNWRLEIAIVGQLTESVSSFLIHHGGYHDLFVCPY